MARAGKKKETFEQALTRLEKIVGELESGELSLDDSLARYEEGAVVLRSCREILEAAEKRIEMLVKDENGKLTARPFRPGGAGEDAGAADGGKPSAEE